MTFLRRLRGSLGIATTWAVGWGLIGAAVFNAVWLTLQPYQRSRALEFTSPLGFRLLLGLTAAVLGFAGGMLFALGLGVAQRHRSVDELPVWRTAALGGLTTLGLYLGGMWASSSLFPEAILPAAVFTTFGAVSAGATLRIAQRRLLPPLDDERLPADAELRTLS